MSYLNPGPARDEVDALPAPTVLEFGTAWCGFCQAAAPAIAAALKEHPAVAHIKIEDGPGRPLGRSFKVKLWPTLIFLNNGAEHARLVRPSDTKEIRAALAQIGSKRPRSPPTATLFNHIPLPSSSQRQGPAHR